MAEEKKEQSVSDALSEGGGGGGKLGGILNLILPLGIAVVFATAGYFVSGFNVPDQAGAGEVEQSADAGEGDGSDEGEKTKKGSGAGTQKISKDQKHHDLDPIIVNLNEPQVTRYLRVAFSLAFNAEDFDVGVEEIKKRSHDIHDQFLVYLSNLSLEDVRGAKNINRVRREIQDLLNNSLWPGKRPLITNVSLKEWIVQ